MSKPVDIHPGLTDERLQIVGHLIRNARHEAVLSHQPTSGDDGWVLGVRCFAWCRHAITLAAKKHPTWLSVVESGLHFVFAVGGVPLRFYRGEPDDAPARTLARNFPEVRAHQMSLLFPDQEAPRHDALRLAIETDEFGEVKEITLVQVDVNLEPVGEGWVILAPEQAEKVAQFPRKEEGKDLGKPEVGSRKKPKESEPTKRK